MQTITSPPSDSAKPTGAMGWNGVFDLMGQINPQVKEKALGRLIDPETRLTHSTWRSECNEKGCLFAVLIAGAQELPMPAVKDSDLSFSRAATILGLRESDVKAAIGCWDGGTEEDRMCFVERIREHIGIQQALAKEPAPSKFLAPIIHGEPVAANAGIGAGVTTANRPSFATKAAQFLLNLF